MRNLGARRQATDAPRAGCLDQCEVGECRMRRTPQFACYPLCARHGHERAHLIDEWGGRQARDGEQRATRGVKLRQASVRGEPVSIAWHPRTHERDAPSHFASSRCTPLHKASRGSERCRKSSVAAVSCGLSLFCMLANAEQ